MKALIALKMPEKLRNSLKAEPFRVYFNETADNIEIFLSGIVGDEYTQSDAASISRILSANRRKPVTMRVNSPGGLAFEGLAIFNALAGHDGRTTGIIDFAASSASLAVIGCDRVMMHENATYHIHEGLSMAFGHIAEMQDAIEWLQAFNEAACMTYAAKTGATQAEMAKALLGKGGDGTKYTAAEALAAGFVDEIIPIKTAPKKAAKNAETTRLQAILNYQCVQHNLTAASSLR